ncbi:MAG: hypothetical protein JWQ71_5023 [Pedosphaera sp.]|nr:hypothetical protein [Pedosphaera sp.]
MRGKNQSLVTSPPTEIGSNPGSETIVTAFQLAKETGYSKKAPMSANPFVRSLMLLAAISVLSGCVSPKQTIVPSLKIVDRPPLNTEQSAELGDTVVSKGKIYSYRGIDLKNQIEAGDGVWILKFKIPPQKMVAKMEDKEWTYFVGEGITSYDAIIGTRPAFGGLKISKTSTNKAAMETEHKKPAIMEQRQGALASSKPMFRPYALFGNSTTVSLIPNPAPDFEYVEVNAMDKPGFTQELIYNGKSGNSVKFLYRELSDSMLRAPFSQDVQYDLKESKIIGFKGLRIEILEATNTQLKYKVITSFPDAL